MVKGLLLSALRSMRLFGYRQMNGHDSVSNGSTLPPGVLPRLTNQPGGGAGFVAEAYNYTALDVTDEKNFILLTGLKEDDFITMVISAQEILEKEAANPGNDTTQTGFSPTQSPVSFDSFQVVKDLKALETKLKDKQKELNDQYSLEKYIKILENIRALWNENHSTQATNGTGDGKEESKKRHDYYDWITDQSKKAIDKLNEFFHGDKAGTGNSTTAGNQGNLQSAYDARLDIAGKLMDELKTGITTFNSDNAREKYSTFHKAYTRFFWNMFNILSIFGLTSFLLWYLISPLSWDLLPIALLLGGLLVFIPPFGFSRLFRNSEKEDDTLKYGWRIAFDFLLPLSISAFILYLNWSHLDGQVLPWLTLAVVFVILLVIKAGRCLLIANIAESFKTAIDALYEKRAFDKHARQHKKRLKAAGLSENAVLENLEEHKKSFLANEEERMRQFEAIVSNDKAMKSRMLNESLNDFYAGNATNSQASYEMTENSPYLREIKDLNTVRRILARLEFLYNIAIAS